jgi:flagellar FliL protein
VKKLLLIGTVLLVLAGAGGGGAWWWIRAHAAPADGAEVHKAAEQDPADTGVLVMEPFLVNLADTESPRFLRTTLQLVIADKKHAEHLGEDAVAKARVRSAILEILTTQHSAALVTTDGKTALKKAIVKQAAHILTEATVVDVLFSEFVVQF